VEPGLDQPSCSRTGRKRPNVLRALGNQEPPRTVCVDGVTYHLREVFKHDSWAATAKYGDGGPGMLEQTNESEIIDRDRNTIVCKFNRLSPIGLIPMSWLGRFLAHREHYFLSELKHFEGIPEVYNDIRIDGQVAKHAVAHVFIDGKPLSLCSNLTEEFFDRVEKLIDLLHQRRIAYVDLHKQENVIVGDDGLPYLIDFQVSMQLPSWRWLDPLFRIFRDCDRYHMSKHRQCHGVSGGSYPRPWLIRAHRKFAVPLRTFRRKFLTWIGVRRDDGSPATEIAPEVGLRRAA